jgi:hypothetical protein
MSWDDLSYAQPYSSGHGTPPTYLTRSLILGLIAMILTLWLFGCLVGG